MLKPETNGPIASFCMVFWNGFSPPKTRDLLLSKVLYTYVEIAGRYRFSANLILFLAAMSAATSYHFSLDVRLRSSQNITTCNCESLLFPEVIYQDIPTEPLVFAFLSVEHLRESQVMCIDKAPRLCPTIQPCLMKRYGRVSATVTWLPKKMGFRDFYRNM